MNRLSPLIARRIDPTATAQVDVAVPFAGIDAAIWLDDLRLFATAWIGGLIFFGTLLG
ncbi:hypothetical protein RCO27_16775 [Sphingosinicella sp. LHD-64]|uniref:hypothetical protein n=1 Tax=Sphingosinicella sp. LHD-64 TaxID=3072139 RepID=UPI00280EC850|nr:hypothetical protein [Sphingosinicella sp. LHD-64]MDQ8757882.1 hypothetical protein [Sphingosinicella sp. LHD-64]